MIENITTFFVAMKILNVKGKNPLKAEIQQNHHRRRWKISQIEIFVILVGDRSILDVVAMKISMVAMEFVDFSHGCYGDFQLLSDDHLQSLRFS
jgi:hypothetical protein